MELHLGVIVIIIHAEALVFGQYVEQLPLALVHEDALVLPELLGAPHQGDVNVINCRSNKMMGAVRNSHGSKLPFHPPLGSASTCHSGGGLMMHRTETDVLLKS